MKKFRTITIVCLSAIAIMIAANAWFMYRLYGTYKQQYIDKVESCVRQADIISWISIAQSTYNVDDSKLNLILTLTGDTTETEWYDYPDVDRKMVEELISAFAAQGKYDQQMKGKNFTIIDNVFRRQLDYAGLQAKSHVPMYMKDWIQKLDDFLKLSGKELLNHAGSVSAEVAKLKANEEYDKFRERTQYQLSPVEIHFLEAFEAERKRLGGKES